MWDAPAGVLRWVDMQRCRAQAPRPLVGDRPQPGASDHRRWRGLGCRPKGHPVRLSPLRREVNVLHPDGTGRHRLSQPVRLRLPDYRPRGRPGRVLPRDLIRAGISATPSGSPPRRGQGPADLSRSPLSCRDGVMGSQRLRAVIAAGPRNSAVIMVPFDPDEAWGAKADHPVSGTIGGCGPTRPSRSARKPALVLGRGGCQQAEGTSARDRVGSPVRAELGVQVAPVGLDGVPRDVQLAGDLRH